MSALADMVMKNGKGLLSGLMGSLGGGGEQSASASEVVSKRSEYYPQSANYYGANTGSRADVTSYGVGGTTYHVSTGYGHDDHGHKECCELVVDPLSFAALLAFIIGGTAFLNTVVTMVLGRKKRRRRAAAAASGEDGGDLVEYLDVMKLGERRNLITSEKNADKKVVRDCGKSPRD